MKKRHSQARIFIGVNIEEVFIVRYCILQVTTAYVNSSLSPDGAIDLL